MKKAVVLVSGGLDSATTLALAREQGYACYAISFDYGQRHKCELDAAQQVARSLGVVEHKLMQLNMNDLGGSALTDESLDVPEEGVGEGIPVTYVPARNTVFLSLALGWAEVLEAEAIFIGVNAVDYSGYPDCRPEYIAAYQRLADLATRRGVEGRPIRVEAPLIHLSKAAIIREGARLGVDYGLTTSCYAPDAQCRACGRCDACRLRRAGFKTAGIPDPTPYQL
ncbi:7-cyano-7-deazaguanine synthase QueC [Thiohalophilus thiocyanatoxydans]|uniref:7-cyano-7-deazaguanine synthase n=1 Tax=Thiohalophilus thiocyanatoxydans TaxID=381308 RepID=A0A4R8ILK9_9GAMM|nr:7-cyano-7-deazaguanine synthase QueC [Thiohalophilus thiocyanatoxydans]TDY01676.1 preQ(0) biosynthesis protein QueC [Thiohalophilus thiocyanatoxydans]